MRIEVYEKYYTEEGYDPEWWENVMGKNTPIPDVGYGYRRTYIELAMIERPIEIPGNKKEMILRMWDTQELIIKENYDDFCLKLHDFEEMEDDDDAP